MGKTVAWAILLAVATTLTLSMPAVAANILVVNQSGAALRSLQLRRVGDSAWRPLAVVTAAGSSARVTFDEKDCAYDLRATLPGIGEVVWNGVNLCDVKRVTLNRDSAGRRWVDYD